MSLDFNPGFTYFCVYRAVSVSEAQQISLNHNCQFLEVSAAESYSGVQLAFHSLLKETRSSQLHRNLPVRRKLGVNSVSKVNATSLFNHFNVYVRIALIYIFFTLVYRPWEIFLGRTIARQIERGHR